jgi:hypothetical protein
MRGNQPRRNRKIAAILFFTLLAGVMLFRIFGNQGGLDDLRDRKPKDVVVLDRYPEKLIFTRHARCRMECRKVTEGEVKAILEKGSVNYQKSELQAKPDPKYAVEGYSEDGQHLRIIFAPSRKGMVVITCIDLNKEWQCNC